MATKKQPATRKDFIENEEHKHRHQPVVSNSLRIKYEHLRTIDPLTQNQRLFFEMYSGGGYFIGLFGSPGVGKTLMAFYRAIEEVLSKETPYKQVVVVRSIVQTRDIGYLPGSLEEKQEIYEMPYKEICTTLFGRPDAWERLKESGHARFISTTAIRGISIDDSIIMVDECQSMTFHELSTVISRAGNRSKIVFCGDRFQNDLLKSKHDVSGLAQFQEIARTMQDYQEVIFTPDDIVRSSLVKNWIVACAKAGVLPS